MYVPNKQLRTLHMQGSNIFIEYYNVYNKQGGRAIKVS